MSDQPAARSTRARTDFTEGEPWKKILAFAVPLMFSSMFQQLYNTVGSIIVGRGVSHVGLAAVGLSGPFLRVLTSMFMGVAMGGNVLIARFYGAKDREGLRRTVHSALVLSVTAGTTLSVIGMLLSPIILRWMNAPEDVYPMALSYMRVLFSGIVFQMTYNMLAGFLRGMGNSHTQLTILICSSISNAVQTYIYVIIFKWGVAGSALATVISQFLSVVLVFIHLQRNEWTHVSLKEIRIHPSETKEVLRIGLPTAVQQVTMSLAGMIVMGFITSYGTETIAGYSAGNTVDMYVMMPVNAFNMSVTPYTAQNIGAGKIDRVFKGAKQFVILNVSCNLVLATIVLSFNKTLLSMFTSNAATIAAGANMMRWIVPTTLMSAINQPLSGVLRGTGNPTTPMFNTLLMVVIIRIPIILILNPIFNRIEVVYFSQVCSFTCGLIHITYCFLKGKWRKTLLESADSAKLKEAAEAF